MLSPVGRARSASSMYFHDSDKATRADAAPPNPLNNATSSGIPVISTRTAIMIPITEPTTSPAIIRVHSAPPAACILTTVVMTATNIPRAPYWLPRGAVLG